jgi:tRNA dimethylallyltransferase
MCADTARPKVVVVCGPTGVGKTSVAVRVAEVLGGEIVNADSMQVYRCMDIGTAKATPEEQQRVRHHLIDIVAPDAPFDAARYAALGRPVLHRLQESGILPLVVGGTGLYIKALLHGLFRASASDPALRARLQAEAQRDGSLHLHQRLRERDPATADRLHPNDTLRIIRALEVTATTGRAISQHHREHAFRESPFQILKIGLQLPRPELYSRIDRRVDAMLAAGLRDEVRGLLQMGYGPELKAMQSIGYRHLCDHLAGNADWETTVRLLKRDTRRYAKRQMTWFLADPAVTWSAPQAIDDIRARVARFWRA